MFNSLTKNTEAKTLGNQFNKTMASVSLNKTDMIPLSLELEDVASGEINVNKIELQLTETFRFFPQNVAIL